MKFNIKHARLINILHTNEKHQDKLCENGIGTSKDHELKVIIIQWLLTNWLKLGSVF